MHKQVQFKPIGMQRDSSESAFDSKFAYENKNIRLVSVGEDNTLLSITNEKGNAEITVYTEDGTETLSIEGTPIGQAILNDNWVIFTAGNESRIYKLWFGEKDSVGVKDTLYGKLLYPSGDSSENLNFSTDYPIETLVNYENEGIQKVYWTDGLNQPRVINISNETFNYKDFNFVPLLKKFPEEVTITKNNNSSGVFSGGTIQYAFTYGKKNGQESNIFHVTPLNYITDNNYGISEDSTTNISFSINISKIDVNFDFVRVYAIQRTSLNNVECRMVREVSIPKVQDSSITLEDTGNIGYSIDPTVLLYVGGESITAQTLSQKDNTLFLGNIETEKLEIDDILRDSIKDTSIIEWILKEEESVYNDSISYYPYSTQLNKNSYKTTTFKQREWYRLGVQFQTKSGKWSQPVWVGDSRVNTNIVSTIGDNKVQKIQGKVSLSNIITENLIGKGYIKARPVVVYPKLEDRDILCQGILCPTVYNVGDRAENLPYVQSSWFTRPNAPISISEANLGEEILLNRYISIDGERIYPKGKWVEFRHNYHIPGGIGTNYDSIGSDTAIETWNPEFPFDTDSNGHFPMYDSSIGNKQEWVNMFKNNYFVDQSIFTLHSPDIEHSEEINNLELGDNYHLDIVGYVPFTASYSDFYLSADNITIRRSDSPERVLGFNKHNVGEPNYSMLGWKGVAAFNMWIDKIQGKTNIPDDDIADYVFGFTIYPWNREGSLNGGNTSILNRKIMSTIRVSSNTVYYKNTEVVGASLADAQLFNSNELGILKLKAPENHALEKIVYQGNIDKIIYPTEEYPLYIYPSRIDDLSTEGTKRVFNSSIGTNTNSSDWKVPNVNDPVRIKYKSTPHIVGVLDTIKERDIFKQKVLPTHFNETVSDKYLKDLFWDTNNKIQGISPIDTPIITQFGYLSIGELVRNDVNNNRFGGDSEEALNENNWVPCGPEVELSEWGSTLNYLEGDTYYQRYDHLKAYPFTQEDKNSVVDVVSFMCETRVNIDGRYDKNIGLLSNLYTTPDNFNKLNKAYSQPNNFFNYRTTYGNLSLTNKFSNVITWTKTKVAGELTDSWTNITLASILELDGNLGPVNAIRRFNNNLLAFQDKGISQILYNENVQIASAEGVPIEIANSGKVSGKRYITDQIGCHNKWSICESPNGLYFIDDINKGIYVFDGSINNVSTKLGFDTWIKSKANLKTWNPNNFSNFITYYDKSNRDILFIDNDTCLAYSEVLGQFTSFYDYNAVPLLANISNRTLMFKKNNEENKIWGHNEGHYNSFFGENKPFYTTLVVNPDMPKDKIFNTVEFRSDTWDTNNNLTQSTFDKLEVWNEYQSGNSNLVFNKDRHSNLKRKFRIWRANIPRDNNGRDRIRNPWAYIKLSKNKGLENTKTVLHDIVVSYFD